MGRARHVPAALAALAVALLFSGCGINRKDAADAGNPYGSVDGWVRQAMGASRIPGVAVGIVKGTDVVYLKGFGAADDNGRPVTPQTPFRIASVSKPITAVAVLQLAEAGKVDLDAPAERYVPGFRMTDAAASKAITVRMLLNQTSGLSTETGNRLNHIGGGAALDELVGQLRSEPLIPRNNGAFRYSNANYVLLASIVERVSGRAYADYVRENIFQPLGMARSAVEPDVALSAETAEGHRLWFGFPGAMGNYSYTSCLNNVSTAEDMAQFLTALLNGGSTGGAAVLSPDSLKLMMRPAAPMGGGASYAMGLEVRPAGSGTIVWHPGDAPGFAADIMMAPDEGLGVVVLQNANWLGMEGSVGTIANGVMDILQGRDPPSLLFSPGSFRLLLDAVYLATLILLARAFFRLGRWRSKLYALPAERRILKLIPVAMVNVTLPAGIMLFVPKFFAADWAQGFLNAPDFSLAMLLIAALLFVLGAIRLFFILFGGNKEQTA